MATQCDRILGDVAYLEHDGVVREAKKAKLFRIQNTTVWIPKRRTVLIDEGDEIVGVAHRWAVGALDPPMVKETIQTEPTT